MKLDTEDVSALNSCGEWFDVPRDCYRSDGEWSFVGVGEVHVGAVFDSCDQARRGIDGEGVPPDVRNFLVALSEPVALPWQVAETGLIGGFGAAPIKPLHTHTDAEEWRTAID